MGTKVLIVEDEGIIAEDIRTMFTRFGCEVVGISSTGKDAIEKVHSAKPELISMDIGIRGDMDGIETARIIRNDFRIPIIFMTSNSDHSTLARTKEFSSWCLFKPLLEKDVIEIARKALANVI